MQCRRCILNACTLFQFSIVHGYAILHTVKEYTLYNKLDQVDLCVFNVPAKNYTLIQMFHTRYWPAPQIYSNAIFQPQIGAQ